MDERARTGHGPSGLGGKVEIVRHFSDDRNAPQLESD